MIRIVQTMLFGAQDGRDENALRPAALVFLATVVGLSVSPGFARLDVPYAWVGAGAVFLLTVVGLLLVSLVRAAYVGYHRGGAIAGILPITAMAVAGMIMWLLGQHFFDNRPPEAPQWFYVVSYVGFAAVTGFITYLVGTGIRRVAARLSENPA